MLPVSRVVNVKILTSPIFPKRKGFGVGLLLGTSTVLPIAERSRAYDSMDEVADDFPSDAPEYIGAQVYFSQSPRADTLRIGRRFTASVAAELDGVTVSTDIATWTPITTGSIKVTVDGAAYELTTLDFSAETNLNGVASVVQAALQGAGAAEAKVTYNTTPTPHFVIQSGTAGTASSVARTGPIDDVGTSTHIGGLLGTDTGTVVAGADPESLLQALDAQAQYSTEWYGLHFTDDQVLTEDDIVSVAGWTEARVKLYGISSDDGAIASATAADDIASRLKAGLYRRSFVLYDPDDHYAALSAFSRAFAVNFDMQNSTITLKFKTLPTVTPSDVSTTQANAISAKNANYYSYFGDSAMVAEGVMSSGVFFDEVHGLDWLQNAIETEVFGFLYTRVTKVPQTDKGVSLIVQAAEKALQQGVNNGLLAPGIWNGTEFGTLKKGDYLKRGFYTYAASVDDQSQSDREARKAPPIQIAAKGAGAIHFVDIEVTFDR